MSERMPKGADWTPIYETPPVPATLGNRVVVPIAGLALVLGVLALEFVGAFHSIFLLVGLAFSPFLILITPLLKGQPARLQISASGVRIRRSHDQFEVPWADIEWVAVRERSFPYSEDEVSHTVSVSIATRDGRRIRTRFPLEGGELALAIVVEALEEKMRALHVEVAQQKLDKGEQLDFGCARLSRDELQIQGRWGTRRLPVAPWRSAKESSGGEARRVVLSGRELRNPLVLVALLETMGFKVEVERTPRGTIDALRILRSRAIPGASAAGLDRTAR